MSQSDARENMDLIILRNRSCKHKAKKVYSTSSMIIFVCFCLTAATACSNTIPVPPREITTTKKVPDQGQSLLIGIIPERNIFEQLAHYEPLADYLTKELGIHIKLKLLPRYGNVVDNFASTGLDGAFFGSLTYTLAHAKLDIEPVARPESKDGVSSYYGLIFVRKDSGIKTAADMKDKVFVFVDRATTAGYLLPLAYFREHINGDYKTYFKETYFAGTHDDAIYDVLNGEADIGAAKNTVFDKLAAHDKRIKDELLIIETSPEVPENGLAVRSSTDSAVKNKLRKTLLGMHRNPHGKNILINFGAVNFIETTDNDYAAVYKYLKKIGLDIASYDYMSD